MTLKPEDWDAYQAQRSAGNDSRQDEPAADNINAQQPSSNSTPPQAQARNFHRPPKERKGLGWPLALLLLGLASIGGCCYSFDRLIGSASAFDASLATSPSVGVLVMENEIYGSIWATDILNRFEKDPNIRSVVIRVNSPGGAVAPCQEIYKAVVGMRKPVVISMGSVAASGGLYVAAAGDYVMANPGTITGSIGVIMQTVEVAGTLDKIGVKTQTIKSGDFKDMGSPFRSMRPDERALLESMVKEVYDQFFNDLTNGRIKARGKDKVDVEAIRQIADGRIFSGTEAHKLGLVDELGGFEDAVMTAAKLGKLPGGRPQIIIDDGRKPWWETVMSSKLNLGVNLNVAPSLEPGLSLKYIYQPTLSSGSDIR